jgi:hypothetical protein
VLTILNFFISPIVKKIKSQKSKSLLGWLWFFCAFDLFLSSTQSLIPFPVAIVPISVFLGDFLSNMKRTFWSGFLFLLLVGSFFYLALLIKS